MLFLYTFYIFFFKFFCIYFWKDSFGFKEHSGKFGSEQVQSKYVRILDIVFVKLADKNLVPIPNLLSDDVP